MWLHAGAPQQDPVTVLFVSRCACDQDPGRTALMSSGRASGGAGLGTGSGASTLLLSRGGPSGTGVDHATLDADLPSVAGQGTGFLVEDADRPLYEHGVACPGPPPPPTLHKMSPPLAPRQRVCRVSAASGAWVGGS
jgi:hypothetical protein